MQNDVPVLWVIKKKKICLIHPVYLQSNINITADPLCLFLLESVFMCYVVYTDVICHFVNKEEFGLFICRDWKCVSGK